MDKKSRSRNSACKKIASGAMALLIGTVLLPVSADGGPGEDGAQDQPGDQQIVEDYSKYTKEEILKILPEKMEKFYDIYLLAEKASGENPSRCGALDEEIGKSLRGLDVVSGDAARVAGEAWIDECSKIDGLRCDEMSIEERFDFGHLWEKFLVNQWKQGGIAFDIAINYEIDQLRAIVRMLDKCKNNLMETMSKCI